MGQGAPYIADCFDQPEKTSGFVSLRLYLALGIVGFHAVTITNGNADAIPQPVMAVARLILPMFFAMSGFLVTASLRRTRSLLEFLGLRIIRLFPALAVVVLASAFVLGPALNRGSIHSYFASHAVISYLANMVALPHYGLPGVFEINPRHGVVNGSLWTIQVEIACYLLLAGIAAIGGLRFPRAFGLGIAFVTLAVPLSILADTFHYLAWIPAPELCVFFLAGAALCLLGDGIPLESKAALAGLGISLLLVPSPTWSCLAALPAAYFTLWAARHCPRWRFMKGDYSYGLYLVAYPLEQIHIQLFPMTHHWWMTAMGALPVAGLCAAGLWHFVEWPILRRKHEVIRRFSAGGRARKDQPAFSAQTLEQTWVRPLPTTVVGEASG